MADEKDRDEPFIEESDRPTPIDYEKPIGELTMRDLLSVIDSRLATGAELAMPGAEWRKPEKELHKEFWKPPDVETLKTEKEAIKAEKEVRKPEKEAFKEIFKPEKESFKPEKEGIKPEDQKAFAPIGRMRELTRGVESELLEAIEILEAERVVRLAERSGLSVVTFEPSDPDSGLGLLLPGTVTLFVAPAGSEFLDEVGRAFASAEAADVHRVVAFVNERGSHRSRVSPIAAARELAGGRAFASLRYGRTVLAENLGLPAGIGFGAISFPYAGLKLDPAAFEFEQYVRHDFHERLDGILVVRPPVLSNAERAALELVPPEMIELGIRSPGNVAVTVTTVTVALFVVAVHTPTLTGGRTVDELRTRLDSVALAAEKIASMPSKATLGELVALRRDLQAELF